MKADFDGYIKKITHFTLITCNFVLVSSPEASAEATHIISAISEVATVPAPCDTEAAAKGSTIKLHCVLHLDILFIYLF